MILLDPGIGPIFQQTHPTSLREVAARPAEGGACGLGGL